MKRIQLLGILVILLLLALVGFYYGIAGHFEGWLTAAGAHIARDQHEADVFRGKLSDWFDTHGFALTEDPGGMVSWAGCHNSGEVNKNGTGEPTKTPHLSW